MHPETSYLILHIYLIHYSNPGTYHNLAWKKSSIDIWWNNMQTNKLNITLLAEKPEVLHYTWDLSRSFSAEFLYISLTFYTLKDLSRSPCFLVRAQIPRTGQNLLTSHSFPGSLLLASLQSGIPGLRIYPLRLGSRSVLALSDPGVSCKSPAFIYSLIFLLKQ